MRRLLPAVLLLAGTTSLAHAATPTHHQNPSLARLVRAQARHDALGLHGSHALANNLRTLVQRNGTHKMQRYRPAARTAAPARTSASDLALPANVVSNHGSQGTVTSGQGPFSTFHHNYSGYQGGIAATFDFQPIMNLYYQGSVFTSAGAAQAYMSEGAKYAEAGASSSPTDCTSTYNVPCTMSGFPTTNGNLVIYSVAQVNYCVVEVAFEGTSDALTTNQDAVTKAAAATQTYGIDQAKQVCTGSSPAPQPTPPVANPTPTPVTPPSGYPDPVTLLTNTVQVYQQIKSAHFDVVTDGDQPNVESLHLDAVGDVTCKGPSLKGHLAAKDTLGTTNKVSTLSVNFIIVKKTAYQKSKSTNNQWKKTPLSNFSKLGIAASNLLLCPGTSSGLSTGGSSTESMGHATSLGTRALSSFRRQAVLRLPASNATNANGTGVSSGGNGQFKNLVNLGPATFQGHAVWHIQATEVSTDASGQSVQGTYDLFLDQTSYVPYEQEYRQTDQGVTLTQKQTLTQFGKTVTIAAPAVHGSLAALRLSTARFAVAQR